MATVPLIFPSLSRQPSMDSSKTLEDDTIRDQMESGYVATRPRYTRTRRTWKINVRNLVAEDVRALDEFAMVTAARGGNSFLYPNLLPNGSFEFPAPTSAEVAQGWRASNTTPQQAISISTTAVQDGTHALSFSTVAGQSIPANSTITAQAGTSQQVPCSAGEVYVLRAMANASKGALADGVLSGSIGVSFFARNGESLGGQTSGVAVGVGWQIINTQFTVPANATSFSIQLSMKLSNSSVAAIALDSSASILWDAMGCALCTPLTPYGRMAGSHALGCLVRFSRLPETSDIGVGQGVKRYGASFDLVEV